jgi:RimJ/RimL family protein N-acetyltransferase
VEPPEASWLDDGVVRLRPVDKADADRTRAWRNDAAIWTRTMGFRLPITESMEDSWFDAVAADNTLTRVVFGIEHVDPSEPAELIGLVFLNAIDWPSRTASFGVFIGPSEQRGKGLGGRVLRLTEAYAARSLGLRKLTLSVVAGNDPAVHLYERAGWVTEGRQREQFFADGALHDVILMGRFLDADPPD